MKPEISVIIVNYNAGDRLVRCIEALEAQTYVPDQIIVIDNASHDGSAKFLEKRETVRLIRNQENVGFAAGVNQGVKKASGDWVVMLNPDAYPAEEWLHHLADGMNRYGENTFLGSLQIDAASPDILDGTGDVYHATGIAWRGGFGAKTSTKPIRDMEIFAPCAAASAYHRETFLALGGFEESFFCYHEDIDLGARHRLQGGKAILLHQASVLHEGSGISGRRSDFTVFHGTRNRIRTFIRVMPPALFWSLLPLHIIINLAFWVRSFRFKAGSAYASGFREGLFASGKAWRDRKDIQYKRRISTRQFLAALTWSPIKLLKRGQDLREVQSVAP